MKLLQSHFLSPSITAIDSLLYEWSVRRLGLSDSVLNGFFIASEKKCVHSDADDMTKAEEAALISWPHDTVLVQTLLGGRTERLICACIVSSHPPELVVELVLLQNWLEQLANCIVGMWTA